MYQYQCLKPREQQRLQPELIPDAMQAHPKHASFTVNVS